MGKGYHTTSSVAIPAGPVLSLFIPVVDKTSVNCGGSSRQRAFGRSGQKDRADVVAEQYVLRMVFKCSAVRDESQILLFEE